MMRRHRPVAGWSAPIFLALGLWAGGPPTIAGAVPQMMTAVKAARLLNVVSGVYEPDAVVLISDGVINKSGSRLPIPAGATVIDLGGATLLPGLIDAHTHLMARFGEGPNDYARALLTKSLSMRSFEAAANASATLKAGFTTVRDVESEGTGYADVDLRKAIHAGLIEGPRMQVATRGIAMVGQYNPFGVAWDLQDFPTGAQMVSGVEEARRAAREQIGHGADLLKVYVDWQYATLSVEEIRAVVEEAHRFHKKVAAHATTPEGIDNAVQAGVDSIEHATFATPDNLRRMKAKDIAWVTTEGYYFSHAKSAEAGAEEAFLASAVANGRANIALGQKIGLMIVSGFDPSSAEQHGRNAEELVALSEMGLGPLGAIRAATLSASTLMGWRDKVGSLEPGRYADIIAVQGDPLADVTVLRAVAFVMKGGEIVRNDVKP